MFLKRLAIVAVIILAGSFLTLKMMGKIDPANPLQNLTEMAAAAKGGVDISDKRADHILYGDKTGGGHLHGQKKACKSEFPADWSKKEVLSNIKKAANDNTISWKKQANGYFSGEKKIEDVNIRVVLSGDKKEVISAYPTNTKKNPCPVSKQIQKRSSVKVYDNGFRTY